MDKKTVRTGIVGSGFSASFHFEAIKKVIAQTKTGMLTEVRFKEQYLGDKIEKGKRGIVFSLVYQLKTRTLTEAEVNVLHEKICQKIIDSCRAVIR